VLQTTLDIFTHHAHEYFTGLWITLVASVLSLLGSLLLGIGVAVFCVSPWRGLVLMGRSWVELIRNTPLLIQVFFFYYGLPSLKIPISALVAGTLGLTIYTSAFIAEAIRAGILSIPPGQSEAARASGLTYGQTMWYVLLPQAVTRVLPAVGNQFLNLVKNSAVLSVIAGMDLMYQADLIAAKTFHIFETYLVVAFFYLLLTLPLSFLVNWLEQRYPANR
jgi:putative glutamine transport system permease protein